MTMKKFFTLLLMLACALFVGVSCVQDQPDGPAAEVIDEVTPETFEIKFDEKTLTCANANFYCVPANKTKPYMMISSQELNDDNIKSMISGTTIEQKLRSLLSNRVLSGVVVWPVDNNALYKGDSKNYSKAATRASNSEKVEVYVVGVKILATEDLGGGDKLVLEAELSTGVTTVQVPFLPYPVLTLGQLAVNLSSAEGSTTVDCTLENPVKGNEVRCESSASWVHPSYENGVLTIAYDANPYAISRKATVSVEYGKEETLEVSGKPEVIWVPLVYEKNIDIVQDANPDAPVYTFELEHVASYFNKVVVNITPSDNALADNVDYVAKVHTKGADWATVAANNMRYPENHTYLNGSLTGHAIKVSSSQLYIDNGDEYCVYVYAVDKAHTVPISEVTTLTVTHTTEGTPKLGFTAKEVTEGSGAHYKVFNDSGWVVEISKGGLIEIPFVIDNPIDGSDVYFNDGGMLQEKKLSDYDNKFGVVGEGGLVSTKDGKLVFTANDYPSDWDKEWPPYISIGIKYTNESNDFCVTQQIKVRLLK